MKKIAFIKIGSFSKVNDQIEKILKLHFPQYELTTIDVAKNILNPKSLKNIYHIARQYGFKYGFSREIFSLCSTKTDYFAKKLKRKLKKIIDPQEYLFTIQTQSMFDASVPGIPHFVYTDHTHLANLSYEKKSHVVIATKDWLFKEKKIYENAIVNFTTSEFASNSIENDYGIDKTKIQTIYSGINIDWPDFIPPKEYNDLKILFVGINWERKGGDILLKAFEKLNFFFPNVELRIAGCSPKINKKGVKILGQLSKDQLEKEYQNCHIFCLPGYREPSAVALIEAAAFELPIIASNVGGTADRVIDNYNGFLIEPGDVNELYEKMLILIKNPEIAIRFGKNGRELVKQKFLWSVVGEKLARRIKQELYILNLIELEEEKEIITPAF